MRYENIRWKEQRRKISDTNKYLKRDSNTQELEIPIHH